MKNLFVALFVFGFALNSFADIQDPPSHDYGPTRKLGRGLSNMVWGWSEASVNIAKVSQDEGNAAGGGYGVVRGVGRSFARFGAGLFEAVLFPIPGHKGYMPILPSDNSSIHRGYQEFPPELGNESKYPYVRDY